MTSRWHWDAPILHSSTLSWRGSGKKSPNLKATWSALVTLSLVPSHKGIAHPRESAGRDRRWSGPSWRNRCQQSPGYSMHQSGCQPAYPNHSAWRNSQVHNRSLKPKRQRRKKEETAFSVPWEKNNKFLKIHSQKGLSYISEPKKATDDLASFVRLFYIHTPACGTVKSNWNVFFPFLFFLDTNFLFCSFF